jgi:hypothetical protein
MEDVASSGTSVERVTSSTADRPRELRFVTGADPVIQKVQEKEVLTA